MSNLGILKSLQAMSLIFQTRVIAHLDQNAWLSLLQLLPKALLLSMRAAQLILPLHPQQRQDFPTNLCISLLLPHLQPVHHLWNPPRKRLQMKTQRRTVYQRMQHQNPLIWTFQRNRDFLAKINIAIQTSNAQRQEQTLQLPMAN